MEENDINFSEHMLQILKDAHGKDFINEFFMAEDLENYIRERNVTRSDWDDPTDWVNGMSMGIAFALERCLDVRFGRNLEAKLRVELAIWLMDLIRSIERNE